MKKTHPTFIPGISTLETPRLILRIDTEADYCDAFRTAPDAVLMARFGIADAAALELEKQKVACGMTTYRTALLFIHLAEKETGTVVGSFAYHNWYPQHRRSEIGYAMKADAHKNKGYMREALPQMIAYGFEAMGLNRIEAFISPDNVPSQRLVLRAGFRKEAALRQHYCIDGVPGDSQVYALLRQDYTSSRDRAAT